jgi:muramoyltetrapeptide carboxypeptidase LdcA involved in peptidoglycan recycling
MLFRFFLLMYLKKMCVLKKNKPILFLQKANSFLGPLLSIFSKLAYRCVKIFVLKGVREQLSPGILLLSKGLKISLWWGLVEVMKILPLEAVPVEKKPHRYKVFPNKTATKIPRPGLEKGSTKDQMNDGIPFFIIHHPSAIHLKNYRSIPSILEKAESFLKKHGSISLESLQPNLPLVPRSLFWLNEPQQKWIFMLEQSKNPLLRNRPKVFLSSRGGNGANFLWDFCLQLYRLRSQTVCPKSFYKSPNSIFDANKSMALMAALKNSRAPLILVGCSDHSALALALLPLGGYGIHGPGLTLSKEIRPEGKNTHIESSYHDVLGLLSGRKKGTRYVLQPLTSSNLPIQMCSGTFSKGLKKDRMVVLQERLNQSSGVVITNLTLLENYLAYLAGLDAYYSLGQKKDTQGSKENRFSLEVEKSWVRGAKSMKNQFFGYCRNKILFIEDTDFQPHSFLRTLESLKPFFGIFAGIVLCSFGSTASQIARLESVQKSITEYWAKNAWENKEAGGPSYNTLPPIFFLSQKNNLVKNDGIFVQGPVGHGESLGACFQGNVKVSTSLEQENQTIPETIVLTIYNPLLYSKNKNQF